MELLEDLLIPTLTPGVPKEIRQRAGRVLRHYPGSCDLFRSAKLAPDIWGDTVEIPSLLARLSEPTKEANVRSPHKKKKGK